MDSNEDMVVIEQGSSIAPNRGIPCINLFRTLLNALMIIWVKDVGQRGRGCVIPRGSYVPVTGP